MKLYSKKEVDIYIKKLLELKWDTYDLYLVGGALYKQETKDIDICIVGRNDSNKVFKLMEQSRSLGPFDVYYWGNKDQIGNQKPYSAKSYDRGHNKAKQRKGEWIDGLFWQHLDFSCKKFNPKPLLIYKGSGS
tara:strand:+ start:417 stop:815 length:399 start_codon:yes stop_codon:yes gene_type:complete